MKKILCVIMVFVLMLQCGGCGGASLETEKITDSSLHEREIIDEGKTVNEGEILEVHFIDVGQGDAVLIKQGLHAMLIDAGNNNQGENVLSYLQSQNIEKLEYVIGTHADADHVGGLDTVMGAIEY